MKTLLINKRQYEYSETDGIIRGGIIYDGYCDCDDKSIIIDKNLKSKLETQIHELIHAISREYSENALLAALEHNEDAVRALSAELTKQLKRLRIVSKRK